MTFEEIYSEHHKLVYNLALQFVQNIEDAEEITQDVFVKVHNSLDAYRNLSDIKTWIYRIAINQSLDFIKARKSKKRKFLLSVFSLNDSSLNFEPSEFNHPGISIEEKEAMNIIFSAINQLSDNQKTAIILLKIEGKSQNETAEIMNIHVKALESLYQRAKKNLNVLLNRTKG